MAQIDHEITVSVPQAKVYEALTTLKGLKSWYSANAEGDGKIWRFAPLFRFEVTESSLPNKIEWSCIEGPNDSVGTTVSFRLSPAENGRTRTLIELTHKSWPGTQGNFRKCNTYWGVLLDRLKTFVETRSANPAFDK